MTITLTEEIVEGKKILAEFMGCKVEIGYKSPTKTDYTVTGEIVKEWRKLGLETGGIDNKMLLDNCAFDTSWEWLMPACKKFDRLYLEEKFPNYYAYQQLCDHLDNAVTTYDIDEAFKQLVENVKWYNENKVKV